MRVLVEPLSADPDASRFFRAVLDSLQGEGALLITDMTDTERPLRAAYINGVCTGAAPPEHVLGRLLAPGRPVREAPVQYVVDGREYILEDCLPFPRMYIAGGGHVALPTARIAAQTGFEVTVIDDRAEFARPERFPWAARTRVAPEYADCFAGYAPEARDYIVIVTRGHRYDGAVLAQALQTRAGYIGMIGSSRKREQVYSALRGQGVSEEDLARVRCPVGIPLGAETPEEIAVSIVAECIARRRLGTWPPQHTPR
jgi:xanthine dehydrogenase accessory factor